MDIREIAERHYLGLDDPNPMKHMGDLVLLNPNPQASDAYLVARGEATKYAYRRLKDWMLAEEAAQDAYVEMIAYTSKGHEHEFAALFKIALDRCISRIRTLEANRGAVISEDFVVDEETGETAVDMAEYGLMPDQAYEIQEKLDTIMVLTNRMRPKTKRILRRVFIFGYTLEEVAELMNMNYGAVQRAVHRFEKVLEERYEDRPAR